MRLSIEFAQDQNPPLVPEWPTLTARARGATRMVAASACEPVTSSDLNSFTAFRVTFLDGTQTLIRFGLLAANPQAWMIWLGEKPRTHDTLSETRCAAIQIEENAEGWCLRSAFSSLNIKRETGALQILNSQGQSLWQSVDKDFFVGDVPMNFALFKHADGFGMTFDFATCQQIWGGGEQFGSTNLRGRVYDVMNSDALGVNGHLRYQSTPFFVTDQGHSFAMLQCEPGRIDFGARRHDLVTFSSDGNTLGLYLALPAAPAIAIKQWRDVMGGVIAVPEWSYGLWLSRCFYKDEAELRAVIAKSQETHLQASVINLDARAWMRAQTRTDFVWDSSRWSPYETFIPWLRDQGFNVCLWENPYVSSATENLYAEGVRLGYFAKTPTGDVYPYQWVPTGLEGFPQPPVAGLVDFTNPKACAWWQDHHRPFLRAGVTCFKTDFGEEIPHDAVFHDGSTGRQLRNVYADLYNMCVMDVVRQECGDQGILWARSGYTKMNLTPVKWAGDSQTTWTALRASLRGGLSQAVGGAVFWSHDIGGFYGPQTDPELYLRWAQVGLWGSHARMHGTSPREPWEFGSAVLEQVKKDTAFRNALLPYWISCGESCVSERQSFLQPLWLHHVDDRLCWIIEDQFFAGSGDVMVAPYLTPQGGRRVYIPKGEWVFLNSNEELEGGREISIERQSECPVFVSKHSKWLDLFRTQSNRTHKQAKFLG
jgi:alpha-D-xyloside xylohydrolase